MPIAIPHTWGGYRIARALLFAAALTPLVVIPGSYPPAVPRAVFLRTVVEIAGWFLAFALLRFQVRMQRSDFLFWGLLSLTAAYAVSAVFGASPLHSLFGDTERMWGLFSWIHLVVYYLILRTFLRDEGSWTWLLRATTAVGVLMSGVALMESYSFLFGAQWFGNASSYGLYRAAGLAGNTGYLSSYLLLVLGAGALLWSRASTRAERWLYPVASMLLLAGWATTRTRSTLLGLAIATAWALGLNAALSAKRITRIVLGSAIACILVLGGTVATRPALVNWMPGLDRIAKEGFADPYRLIIWSTALQGSMDRPLLGYGLENVYHAYSSRISPEVYDMQAFRGAEHFDRVHNIFLDALVTAGIPGALALLLVWVGLAWGIARAWRSGRVSRAELTVISSTFVVYFVFLNFWFEDWVSFPVFLILAAWLQSRAHGGPLLEFDTPAERSPRHRPALALAAVIVVLAVYQHGVRVLHAAHLAGKARRTDAVDERLNYLQRALRMETAGSRPLVYLLAQELSTTGHQVDPDTLHPYQKQVLHSAMNIGLNSISEELVWDPNNDLLYSVQAEMQYFGLMLHEHPLYYGTALQSLNRAIELSPDRIPYYHRLAKLHLAIGQADAAESALREALRRYDRFAETYLLMATVMLAKENPTAARLWTLRGLAQGHVPPSAPLVRLVADRQPEDVRVASSIDLFRNYLEARYGAKGFSPTDSTIISAAGFEDWYLAAALPVLYLESGDTASAIQAARQIAAALPAAAPRAKRFIGDVRTDNGADWIRRGRILERRDLEALAQRSRPRTS